MRYNKASVPRVHFALSCFVAPFQTRGPAARNHLATSRFIELPVLLPRVPVLVNSFFQTPVMGRECNVLMQKIGKCKGQFPWHATLMFIFKFWKFQDVQPSNERFIVPGCW